MRQWVWLVIVLASCSAPAAKVAAPAAKVTPAAEAVVKTGVITAADGEVTARSGPSAAWTEVDVGDRVPEAGQVRTGRGATAELQFGRLGILHLEESTIVSLQTLRLGDSTKNVQVELAAGAVTAKVSKLLGAQKFQIRTDTVAAGVRGTRFRVSHSAKGTTVAVAEGSVGVASPQADPLAKDAPLVKAGQEAQVATVGATPVVMPLEGANLRALNQTQGLKVLDALPDQPAEWSVPQPLTPAPGATVPSAPTLTMKWKPVKGASVYIVTLEVQEGDHTRPMGSWSTTGASVTLRGFDGYKAGKYIWAVTAKKNNLNFTETATEPSHAEFQLIR